MDLKLYRPTVPNFQPQQPSQQNPQQRVLSNTTTLPMSSTFLNFPYENSNEFSWTSSVNGNINNMMNLNNGPQFPRHMASPPPPPLMNPPFPHNGFAAPPPPPQHFSSGGPVGGFQQPPFANGLISPLHSPGLGPVIPHMHNSNGNNFAPPPPSYHNIPPPSASLGSRNHNQHQIPPPPNFAMSSFNNSMTGVMHNSSRENGLGHHLGPFPTPPVSAPSSPSPPPPHMINGSVPTQLPPLSFQSSIPRTVGTRTANKPLTPPLAKSTLATSTVISRNEPAPVSTNNDQSTSSTLKPKFNPNAASFQPVVKSPAIVSSTPPPKRAVTPPTKTRPHPFNPLSSQFTPSTCSTPSRDEQAERRASGKFNPDAPAFVPVSETPPLPARSSPPPNAPTGPASLVPRTNPPPGSASSIPPYPKLPLSPPTGPKADRNKMPPRPIFGLGIGMGAANEIQERGLPPTTPSGPKAMTTPTGPRADRERPLSRNLSSREGYHPRSYSGSDSYNPREKYAKEPPLLPTVALTRIPGIDKPVPTGPAAMLADLPPAAKIPDVPIAPAAMLAKMESGSQNGSDDGSRGRPGYLMRSSSHTYTRSVIRRWSGRVSQSRNSWVRENDDSRNASKSRDGSDTPVSVAMEIEVTFQELPKTEDIPPLTEEPESYEDEATPAVEALEKTLEEDVEVSATMEKESIKEDEEELVMLVEEVTIVEEPKAPLVVEIPLDESVLPEVKPIAHVEKAASEMEVGTTVVTPALLEQPVFTTDLALEVPVVPASDKVEGPSAPPMEIAVTPVIVSLPSIQIEADDSSRKEVDLDKDLDANLDSFPEFSPAARAATPPLRLSEISMKKREEEGDEIGKNKDVIVAVKEEVAPVEEPEKDKASVEVKPVTAPIRDGSEILTARRATKKSKKKAKKEKKNQTVMAIEPEVASVNPIPVSIAPVEVASEDDIEAPIIKKPSNRGAVVIGGFVHQDGAGTRPVAAVEKNSEQEVGFIAESPLPVEQSVSEVEEVDAMALDAKDEEKPILEKLSPAHKQESEKEVAKATLEENDNEKEHDGGVKLDTIDTLPPLPEDLDEQLVKLTEIYSDSESVKDEQDDEDAAAPVEEEEEEDEEEPIVEVRPLQVIKAAAPILPSEEELFGAEPEKLGEDVVVLEEESPIAPAQEPVAVVEEPIVNAETEESLVAELLEELLVPAVEAPIVEEVVKEAAFFEPRHTGEIAVSVNSIIGALAACKDINSLSGTLASFSRVSKPGTQEERLFRELHHYAAIADPVGRENSDNRSTRSKSSMRSVRSFFKRRAEAYPQLLSSTTIRIKAILPPFLSMTAAPAINTIPTSGTITPTEQKSSMVSSSAVKSQRSRLLPKMTMSLLSRSFSTKSQKNVVA